ncbi:hypothetical protein NY2A_b037R [Paramecium bursaria Chlorella virus NY2A]|uniref:Uncharacterized protein b037R n=1 Tax=Paramecium bursaria Chlorella virus NY2A TaxID=46021 RepID=A7IVR2_PBCVN|nr:hypothetical protein NY2A_b037R [Paramecium bursaria Chlorella virus NY2A]YP_001498116.1 hypothetical protein AR158_C034R [Paramecium bursaria Chlorella virus AR158]ABT14436.1 hypothetical protein NY2A_b037R [Paramecium bursaria Chlorella virus NY2A]ABU43580.1 hypothetical protein AR158_C034R [Paramecium bursaria Chlorella virus AR158]
MLMVCPPVTIADTPVSAAPLPMNTFAVTFPITFTWPLTNVLPLILKIFTFTFAAFTFAGADTFPTMFIT